MRLLTLAGDGIGPEITAATRAVLDAADQRFGLGLRFEEREIGFAALARLGTTLPDEVLAAARSVDGTILGPIGHLDYPPRDKGGVNVSAAFRVKLDLFANVRPAKTRSGVPRRGADMDLVIVRECTEGMYPDRNMHLGHAEVMPTVDVALSIRKITRPACRRIALWAFELARTRRKKVTAIHKANNFIVTDGLFLEEVRGVAAAFPDVTLDELIVDAAAAWLVRDPARFDVIVSTNFYSDILSDLASELCGGLGLAAAINANSEMCVAQAQHGSAPDIAGQGRANPTSLILSSAMLLQWLGRKHDRADLRTAAAAIEGVVDQCLSRAETRTRDIGGELGTAAFGALVASRVSALAETPNVG
jgi:3-isopropylmalate dehydrogenase